jgi:predicted flap endonuclease-1-like 5' DNA nuclease
MDVAVMGGNAMQELLTLGWPWFAACAALGLVVGFTTATRGGGGVANAWLPLLALLLVGAAAYAVHTGAIPGRQGLIAEIGVYAALAHLIGLPIGGAIKGALPAEAAATTRPRPAPVKPIIVSAPASMSMPEPEPDTAPEIPAPEAEAPVAVETAAAASTVVEKAAEPVLEKARPVAPKQAAASSEKSAPGRRPDALSGPRGAKPDDLTRIKGVGPKSVEKLHALGVFHFDQIAAWNLDNARWIGAALSVPGRVERGKWIQQARELAGQQREGQSS